MAKKQDKNLFQKLTDLFRSGPVVKRKIRSFDTAVMVPDKTKSSGALLFQKSQAPTYATITANAYNLSERLMRYQDFNEMEYCLHGGTRIAVPGGYKTLEELSVECNNNPEHTFIVYSYDHNLGRIIPALGKQARQTRVDHSFLVKFDNGQELIGTSNHRLMKRDGTFCQIGDLKPGDAMMPFYRRDLFSGSKDEGDGYRWIYTMDKRGGMKGWTAEHRLIGEFIKGSPLDQGEVVHHCNFVKWDNNPSNLAIMTEQEHKTLHAEILNGKKWSHENGDWISRFKENHSKFMTHNNPAERKDITFGRILELAEKFSFNSRKICDALDTDPNVIKRKLRKAGYSSFEIFAKAYNPDWKNSGWDNSGSKNPRFDHRISFDSICSAFSTGKSIKDLSKDLDTTPAIVTNRLKSRGYSSYSEFSETYSNLKVESVQYHGVIPLYDLTVDGYKNFATDSVISHNTPEIAAALDIYSDETVAQDEKGRVLHIFSDNEKIRDILEDLFYNTLNVEFNLRSWARNLVKFGDFFLYNDVHPDYGVVSAFPIPVNEIEREENYDPNDPMAVRYRWVTLGNRTLENWEVTHFRLLGNDMFLPYGSSVIEPARRIWRQLILIEDAMLVYRVVRAPERRVFYIDVANIPAAEVPTYVEEQRKNLRSNQVIDRTSGRVDLRYNPMSVDEDFYIPVRGTDTGTRIETLAGGQNTAAVEDVAYIQKKLFAALKIPRAYLGYDEMLSSKATLAQEDIRFSRTINVIQRVMLAELNKLAIIHLYANGFDGEDLQNFVLRLSNPSTIAQQQKLELWRAKFEIAGAAPEGYVSKNFVRKEIWGLNDEDCKKIDDGRMKDKMIDQDIESSVAGGDAGGGGGGDDPFGGGGGGGDDLFGGGGDDAGAGGDTGGEENAADDPMKDEENEDNRILLSSLNNEDDSFVVNVFNSDTPIRGSNIIGKRFSEQKRARKKERSPRRSKHEKHMPDLFNMVNDQPSLGSDPFGMVDPPFKSSDFKFENRDRTSIPADVLSSLRNLTKRFGERNNILKEQNNIDERELFILDEDD